MSDPQKPANKTSERIQVTGSKTFFDRIREVMSHEGIASMSETIRSCFNRYYNETFRKEAFGYQSGSVTTKTNLLKEEYKWEIENYLDVIQAGTDEEATALIHKIGYITEEQERLEKTKYYVKTNELGARCLHLEYNAGGSADTYNLSQLVGDVKRFLKQRYRNKKKEQKEKEKNEKTT